MEFDSIDGPHPLVGLDRYFKNTISCIVVRYFFLHVHFIRDVSWRSSMPNLMSTGERYVPAKHIQQLLKIFCCSLACIMPCNYVMNWS